MKEIRDLGVSRDNLVVLLKRKDPDQTEPFPPGTRYIMIPDDSRGLEVPIGFGIAFLFLGAFFAWVVPSIGVPTFLVFISLAAILFAGSFTRVGIQPILVDMEAPREDSGAWNDQFEMGKVLIFAITDQRSLIRPIREILQDQEGGLHTPRWVPDLQLHHPGTGVDARRDMPGRR